MKNLKLYVMKVGRLDMPDKGHMTPGSGVGEPISMPVYCYLIDHPKGLVLVDTGVHNEGPATVNEEDLVVNRIAEAGYKAEDVKYVVMTHMHVDHAAYMTEFPNATFVVRREELKAAWWPEVCEKGYVYDDYKETRGYDYLQPGDDEDYDLFLDGSVVLIDTKGHTRGHQSVVVTLADGSKTVLAGDASSLRENMDEMILPGYCSNSWFAMRSLEKLKHMDREGYTILFGHDVEQQNTLKISPDYYE
ncbi:MAG: N-acyl homoserine lactonase family protein [Bacillota bacterium]|nr:N-acyl homoserine lactonase family protein [Bacillota bacterium]